MTRNSVVQEQFDFSRGRTTNTTQRLPSKVRTVSQTPSGNVKRGIIASEAYDLSRYEKSTNEQGVSVYSLRGSYSANKAGTRKETYTSEILVVDSSGVVVRREVYGKLQKKGEREVPFLQARETYQNGILQESLLYEKVTNSKGTETFKLKEKIVPGSEGYYDVEKRFNPDYPTQQSQSQQQGQVEVVSVTKDLKTGRVVQTLARPTYENVLNAREREVARRQAVVIRDPVQRFQTGVEGRRGSFSGDVGVFPGSKVEKAQYLKDPRSYLVRKSVESAQRRAEELRQQGYVAAEELFYAKVNQNDRSTSARNGRRDNSSPYSVRDLDGSGRFEARVSRLQESQDAFYNSEFFKRIDKTANSLTFGGKYKEDGSYERTLREQRGVIGRYAERAVAGAIRFPAEIGGQAFFGTQKLYALGEARVRSIKPLEGGTLLGSGGDYADAVRKEFLQTAPQKLERDKFSFLPGGTPITEEGYYTLVDAALGGLVPAASKISSKGRATSFIQEVNRNPPTDLFGETFYGQKTIRSQGKGAIVREAEGIVTEIPGVNPTEARVVNTPYKVVTLASGERVFMQQVPRGPQVTTIRGSGKFKDYTLRTSTDPVTGLSRADIFQLVESRPSAWDRLAGFARGKNLYAYDVNLVKLKTFNFEANQGLAFTEALPRLNVEQEFKLEGYTQRQQAGLSQSQGIPLSRKGFVPKGESSLFYAENVQVGQKIPKIDIALNKKLGGKIEIGKTEFEIVDYPVEFQKAILKQEREGFFAGKPVEFKTSATGLAKQKFSIQFSQLGKPPRIKLDLVKAQAKFENRYVSGGFKKLPGELDQFLGRPAESFNPRQSKAATYVREQLAKYDPYGLSGDRLRLTQVEETVQVSRPKIDFTPQKNIIRTNVVPKGKSTASLRPLLLNELSETTIPTLQPLLTPLEEGRILSREITKELTRNDVRNEIIARNKEEIKTLNRLRNLSQTRQQTRTVTQVKTLTRSQTPLSNARPFINIGGRQLPQKRGNLPELDFDTVPREQDVYNVVVYEARAKTGKKGPVALKVNEEPLPYNQALLEGGYYVDNSQSRRFKLQPAGQREVMDVPNWLLGYKFRRPKGRSKLSTKSFVEDSKYAIDTFGEVEDIPLRALVANRKKKGGWF